MKMAIEASLRETTSSTPKIEAVKQEDIQQPPNKEENMEKEEERKDGAVLIAAKADAPKATELLVPKEVYLVDK